MPQVTSVACGFWAMDEDELLWGVGLEWEFLFPWFASCPPWDVQPGTESRSLGEQSGDTSLTGRGSYLHSLNNLL